MTQLGITTILALYKQLARDVAEGDAGLTLVVYRIVSRRSVERGKHRQADSVEGDPWPREREPTQTTSYFEL